jgi:hypothetical protein
MTVQNHPGDSAQAHTIRWKPEPINANILCSPIAGSERPVTMKCLEEYGGESVYINWLEPDDVDSLRYGMFEGIKDFWRGERDLIHIDHDMVFIWDHLRDFVNCQSEWCTSPYSAFGFQINAGLGFMKFSASLQNKVDLNKVRAEADACVDTAQMKGCYGDWWGIEWHLVGAIVEQRIFPCTHNEVMNDHSLWGVKPPDPEPVLNADRHTPEGRASIVQYARETLGWKLEGEPK